MTVWGGGYFEKSEYTKKDFGVPKYPIFTPPENPYFLGFSGGYPYFRGEYPPNRGQNGPHPPKSGGVRKVKSAR